MPAVDENLRRNFTLGVLNGVFFNAALAFLSGSTILPAFISQLTDSKALIGLFSTLEGFGWSFPQLFAAIFIAHRVRVLGFYNSLSAARLGLFAMMIASIFLFRNDFKAILLSFGISFALLSLVAGMAGVAFMEVVGKTIPVNRRGSYFGMRMFFGGVAAALGGLLAKRIISGYPYPHNFGYIYIAGWALMFFGLWAFAYIKEPPVRETLKRAEPSVQLGNALSIFRNDRNFRRLLWSRAWVNTYYLSSPFYIIFAITKLGAPEWIAGVYLTAQMTGFLASNLLWGWLSNHVSNRKVIVLAGSVSVLPPLLAFGSSLAQVSPVVFSIIFFLLGMAESGLGMGYVNYLLETCPEKGRVLSIGLWNTFIAPTLFFSALGGLLSQVFSLRLLFATVFATTSVSVLMSRRLKEPRAALASD